MQLYGTKVLSVVALVVEVNNNGLTLFDVLRVACYAGQQYFSWYITHKFWPEMKIYFEERIDGI